VRIHIDEVPEGVVLAAGMTATVQIDIPSRPTEPGQLDQPGSNRTQGADDSFGGKAGNSRFLFNLDFRGDYRQ
jgi:hypothetical protein